MKMDKGAVVCRISVFGWDEGGNERGKWKCCKAIERTQSRGKDFAEGMTEYGKHMVAGRDKNPVQIPRKRSPTGPRPVWEFDVTPNDEDPLNQISFG